MPLRRDDQRLFLAGPVKASAAFDIAIAEH
jgi:hypothetical protein